MVSDVRRAGSLRLTLFDEVGARLPLFDGLPVAVIERLTADGFGRGLLTGSLRARLRKAGFADMGALALASPAALAAVRKIGPVRIDAIRIHLLGELARRMPNAREEHDRDATDRRRLERLRNVPTTELILDAPLAQVLGRVGDTCADLALRRRSEIPLPPGHPVTDLDRIVAALTRILTPEPVRVPSIEQLPESAAERAAAEARDRARMQRERDREWEAAAPARRAGD